MRELDNQKLLEALLHPVRQKLLRLAIDRDAFSTGDAAKSLRRPSSDVRYHIKVLLRCGALEEEEIKTIKGAIAKCWRVAPAVKETRWILEALGFRTAS